MPTPRHSIFTNQTLSLMPKQQCQSTEGHKTTQHLANVTPLRKTKTKKTFHALSASGTDVVGILQASLQFHYSLQLSSVRWMILQNQL